MRREEGREDIAVDMADELNLDTRQERPEWELSHVEDAPALMEAHNRSMESRAMEVNPSNEGVA